MRNLDAREDLLSLLRKQRCRHPHNFTGTYDCYMCLAGSMTIVYAWLGVDPRLRKIDIDEDIA